MIFARKINQIPEFYTIFARKMPEFWIIITQKIFFHEIWVGARVPPAPPPPPSPTPMDLDLATVDLNLNSPKCQWCNVRHSP